MRYRYLSFLLIISLASFGQKKDAKLQKQIIQLTKNFNGDIGIYIHNLKHNKIVSINADSVFPTASIVKIPILIGVMSKIQAGQLNYHQRLTYTDSLFY